MRFNDSYDWIVLGDHPGALLSGILAARLGHSVLILPLVPSLSLAMSKSGQYVDLESNFLMGFGRSEKAPGLLGDCFKRFGILASERELFLQESGVCQSVTPENRLLLSTDDDVFAAEIIREFGKDFTKRAELTTALKYAEHELGAFWMNLPNRLTITAEKTKKDVGPVDIRQVRRKLAKGLKSGSGKRRWIDSKEGTLAFAKRFSHPAMADALIGLLAMATGNHPNGQTSVADLFYGLVMARTAMGFKGGITAYRHFLLRMAERAGAHLAQKGVCRRVFIERGRFTGVQIASRGNMVAGQAGILGCSLAHAREFLSISGRSWFGGLKEAPKPGGWKYTVALTVHGEAIPPGMLRRTIWQEPGAPSLEIEIADPADYNQREADHQLIFVRTILPFTAEGISLEYQRVMAARMIRQLKEVMPFLEFHIVRVYPAVRENESASRLATRNAADPEQNIVADELSEIYGFASPEVIPENLRCFDGKGVGSRSGIEGLFVATGESFPEMGTLGPTLAAFESVAWLAHKTGLPGPLAN